MEEEKVEEEDLKEEEEEKNMKKKYANQDVKVCSIYRAWVEQVFTYFPQKLYQLEAIHILLLYKPQQRFWGKNKK